MAGAPDSPGCFNFPGYPKRALELSRHAAGQRFHSGIAIGIQSPETVMIDDRFGPTPNMAFFGEEKLDFGIL